MNKKLEQKWEEENKRGRELLDELFLKYKEYILEKIHNDPDLLDHILYELGISKEDFDHSLENYKKTNITFYVSAVDAIEAYEKQKGTDA